MVSRGGAVLQWHGKAGRLFVVATFVISVTGVFRSVMWPTRLFNPQYLYSSASLQQAVFSEATLIKSIMQ